MPLINRVAKQRLIKIREGRGLNSPEVLAEEIRLQAAEHAWGKRGTVDAHTIRRIETHGHVPGVRVRFVIAHYFGVAMTDIWDPEFQEIGPATSGQPAAGRVAA